MNITPSPDPAPEAMLSELAALGMRAARVVVRVMEIEQAAAEAAVCVFPLPRGEPDTLSGSAVAGQCLDAINAAMTETVPRIEMLARALDRVSRLVRRSLALLKRMQAGWPRAGAADDRQAMVRRQVARGVSEVIARESDGEAAERLFDDLAERLNEPGLDGEIGAIPVEESVRRLCHDLGLATESLAESASRVKPGVERTTVLSRGVGQRPTLPKRRGPPDTC